MLASVPLTGIMAGASLFALAATAPALAAPLDLAAPITGVTVHPDAAQVTREGSVTLPAGATMLVLRGLPPSVDAASLRINARGQPGLVLGGIEWRTMPANPAQPAADSIAGRLKALMTERDTLNTRIAALEGRKRAIERYAELGPDRLGPDNRPLDVAQWPRAWEAIGEGLSTVLEETRVAQAKLAEIEESIARLEQANRPDPGRDAPRRDVLISIESAQAGEARFEIGYRVAGARWLPTYDARLTMAASADGKMTDGKPSEPALRLERRAEIVQRSGEDWSDVTLVLSTVRALRGTAAPGLSPLIVDFQPPPQPAPMPRSEAMDRARAMAAREMAQTQKAAPDMLAASAPPMVAAESQEATLDAGAFEGRFTVPGKVSVTGDGSPRAVLVGTRQIRPAIVLRTVPAFDPSAYVTAGFEHGEEAPLLPGAVSLFRDGHYVGRGRLPLVAPGERAELSFGATDLLRVTRTPVSKRESEPGFLGSTRTDQREWLTKLRNLHAFPVKVIVMDRLPVSEQSAIVVEQLRETTPPGPLPPASPGDGLGADRRGLVAWTLDLAPGATSEIRFGWRVKWPQDREIMLPR